MRAFLVGPERAERTIKRPLPLRAGRRQERLFPAGHPSVSAPQFPDRFACEPSLPPTVEGKLT
jgi:hypothetical protein